MGAKCNAPLVLSWIMWFILGLLAVHLSEVHLAQDASLPRITREQLESEIHVSNAHGLVSDETIMFTAKVFCKTDTSKKLTVSASTVSLVEHNLGLERIFLVPDRIDGNSGLAQFNFKVTTEGDYTITVFYEEHPRHPIVNWTHPRNLKAFSLASKQISVVQKTSQRAQPFPCSHNDYADLENKIRWKLPDLSGSSRSPETELTGSSGFISHDSCAMYYFNEDQAQTCLAGRSVVFVGGSAMSETAIDFAMIVEGASSDLWPAGKDHAWTEGIRSCNPPLTGRKQWREFIREWEGESDAKGTKKSGTTAMVWTAAKDVCVEPTAWNQLHGSGVFSFADPIHLDRLIFKLQQPNTIDFLPHPSDSFEKLYRRKEHKFRDSDFGADIIVFDAGIVDTEGFGMLNTGLHSYRLWLDTILQALKLGGHRQSSYFFLTSGPVQLASNARVRDMNRVGMELAEKHGFLVVDSHAVHAHRARHAHPLAQGHGHGQQRLDIEHGDTVHATNGSSRSPFTHAVAQMILNAIFCVYLAAAVGVRALKFEVPSALPGGSRRCVKQFLVANTLVVGHYEVGPDTKGGQRIDVEVLFRMHYVKYLCLLAQIFDDAPTSSKYYHKYDVDEGSQKFTFNTHETANVNYCFTNTNQQPGYLEAMDHKRTIVIHTDTGAEAEDYSETKKHIEPLEREVYRLERIAGALVTEMDLMKSEEEKMRDVNGTNHTSMVTLL
ncbi:vesicle coat component [Entophlyctis sp. JEL0112]|nr:vesicle coat component [Entophlyctis sp. JEL0112]